MRRMLRIGIIGCGEHARGSHAAPLARYAAQHPGEIALVSACDIVRDRAARFCREFGFVKPYDDVERMFANENLDACVSVMPVQGIAANARWLLGKHIPCVIEKPLGASLEEVEELAAIARATNTAQMVSVNRRFMPYLNRARDWAAHAGKISYIRAAMLRHERRESQFIWETALHALDALRHLAGEVRDYEFVQTKTADLSAAWYKISLLFESGARGQLEVMPTGGMVEESYELFGENFRARVVAGSGTQKSLRCWRDNTLVMSEDAEEHEPEDVRNGSYGEVIEFISALRAARPPRPSIADVLPSSRICFRIAAAAERDASR